MKAIAALLFAAVLAAGCSSLIDSAKVSMKSHHDRIEAATAGCDTDTDCLDKCMKAGGSFEECNY